MVSLSFLSLSLSLSLSPPTPPPLRPSLSVPIYLLIKSEQLWDDSAQCLAVARVSVHVCAPEPRQAASLHALAPPSHLTLSVICFPAMAQAVPCSDCSGIALSSVPVAMATCHTHDQIIALAEHDEKASAIDLRNRIADKIVEIRDSLWSPAGSMVPVQDITRRGPSGARAANTHRKSGPPAKPVCVCVCACVYVYARGGGAGGGAPERERVRETESETEQARARVQARRRRC